MKCGAKQYSDSMVCRECKMSWDMNDPVPPVCPIEMNYSSIPPVSKPLWGWICFVAGFITALIIQDILK